MSRPPEYLNPPEYELNARNFVSEAIDLGEQLQPLSTVIFNLTTSADFLYETSLNYEKELPEYAQELRDNARKADLDSADRNIVMVTLFGEILQAEDAEKMFDSLARKHKGIKGDRHLTRIADFEDADPNDSRFGITQYYLFTSE